MKITRRDLTIGGLSLFSSTSMSASGHAELGDFLNIGGGLEDFWLATDAYVYGYPLVTMEMTRRTTMKAVLRRKPSPYTSQLG